MTTTCLFLLLAIRSAAPVDTLAAGAAIAEMRAKCEEMQDAVIASGLTGDSALALQRDVRAEADALRVAARRNPLSCMCLGGTCGAGLGCVAGVAVGTSQSGYESCGYEPLGTLFAAAAVVLVATVAGAIGAGAGLIVGATGALLPFASARREASRQHRVNVNELVRRYNRLAAGHRPRWRPYLPGTLL